MTGDMAEYRYAIIRTVETKVALAENNHQHDMFVTTDVMKDILKVLKGQENEIVLLKAMGLKLPEITMLIDEPMYRR